VLGSKLVCKEAGCILLAAANHARHCWDCSAAGAAPSGTSRHVQVMVHVVVGNQQGGRQMTAADVAKK
jgi:hypothetical protein